MGAWGPQLFDDDVAADVRGVWEDALASGHSPLEATRLARQELAEMADDPDDGPVFWLALAALQLESNALEAEAREHALAAISPNLERWREEATREDADERSRVLSELRARLESLPG